MKPDKLLFTPGPLTTSATVKQAMLRDLGSRDDEFIAVVRDIREKLLALAGVSSAVGYEAVLVQGSGTFAIESVLSSVVPGDGRLLLLVNGAYGERMVEMARRHNIPASVVRTDENVPPEPDLVEQALRADAGVTHVAMVHCETTSGIMNPIAAVGTVVKALGRCFVVDAMSSFGAVPLGVAETGIDFLISSANKCVEGVPGFAFVIARRADLLAAEGRARTLSLDLWAQWRGLEMNGQFRFTPPTHALLAFGQALRELDAEGGVAARAERYRGNHATLMRGMETMGFRAYVPPEHQSYIISTFLYPAHPSFRFDDFYRHLSERGFVIYPGKLTRVDCFRIGNIGQLGLKEIEALLETIRTVCGEMGVELPL